MLTGSLLGRRYPPVRHSERVKLAGLSILCRPLRLKNDLLRSAGVKAPGAARVLIYHDIAPHERANFEAQLRALQGRWRFVSAQEFVQIIETGSTRERAILLTFDDGYASNRVVAESVLKPLGISALFFVVRRFIEFADGANVRPFIASRLMPGVEEGTLPPHYRNMTWGDLEALLEQGHSIGSHTESHPRLSGLAMPEDLHAEIVDSGDRIARRLGITIDHFAFPFGSLASVDRRAIAIARSRYRFIHSGLRGDNVGPDNRRVVRREAVTPADPVLAVGAILEGAFDARYAGDVSALEHWSV